MSDFYCLRFISHLFFPISPPTPARTFNVCQTRSVSVESAFLPSSICVLVYTDQIYVRQWPTPGHKVYCILEDRWLWVFPPNPPRGRWFHSRDTQSSNGDENQWSLVGRFDNNAAVTGSKLVNLAKIFLRRLCKTTNARVTNICSQMNALSNIVETVPAVRKQKYDQACSYRIQRKKKKLSRPKDTANHENMFLLLRKTRAFFCVSTFRPLFILPQSLTANFEADR